MTSQRTSVRPIEAAAMALARWLDLPCNPSAERSKCTYTSARRCYRAAARPKRKDEPHDRP